MLYAEFMEWVREFQTEPFDDRRCFDDPSARVAALIANAHRDKTIVPDPYEPRDFSPYQPQPTDAERLDEKLILMV